MCMKISRELQGPVTAYKVVRVAHGSVLSPIYGAPYKKGVNYAREEYV